MMGLESQLRDVHLPDIPSIWPLSTLAYIVLFILLVCCFFMGSFLLKKWIRGRAKRKALKQIEVYQQSDYHDSKTISSISILLKRVALAYYPRKEVAGLTGDAWLDFLEKTSDDNEFKKEISKILLTAPYQKEFNDDLDNLLLAVEKWVKKRK